MVLLLFNGRPLTLEWESAHVPAILDVWFGGSETGDAVADVLFGDVNPSGKLTMTFPKNVGQIPIYYAHKNTGRPLAEGAWFQKFRSNYLDVDNEPLYPFGYGLSYTTFSYGAVSLSAKEMPRDGKLASVTRPVKELKGFQKVFLRAGESRTVSFDIDASALGFYDAEGNYLVEEGEFQVFVGPSSQTRNSENFLLK